MSSVDSTSAQNAGLIIAAATSTSAGSAPSDQTNQTTASSAASSSSEPVDVVDTNSSTNGEDAFLVDYSKAISTVDANTAIGKFVAGYDSMKSGQYQGAAAMAYAIQTGFEAKVEALQGAQRFAENMAENASNAAFEDYQMEQYASNAQSEFGSQIAFDSDGYAYAVTPNSTSSNNASTTAMQTNSVSATASSSAATNGIQSSPDIALQLLTGNA